MYYCKHFTSLIMPPKNILGENELINTSNKSCYYVVFSSLCGAIKIHSLYYMYQEVIVNNSKHFSKMKLKGKDTFISNKWSKYFKKRMDLMDLNDLHPNAHSAWGHTPHTKPNCTSINPSHQVFTLKKIMKCYFFMSHYPWITLLL